MTNLTDLAPGYSFGDVITTTNAGQGLTANLLPIQDGLGNQSPMSLSTNSVNFSTAGGNTFKIGGESLTAPVENINDICGDNPTFSATVPVILPNSAIEPAPVNGMIYYNTGTDQLRAAVNGLWVTLA
jgi:hypothetical protein